MSTITIGSSVQLGARIMEAMHEFRFATFVTRLGWSLPMLEGVERDEYDTPDAHYVVVSNSSDRVTACARLLPTTQAYMLADLFPQLLGNRPPPRHPDIWELSRFATSVRESREGRILALSKPTLDLLRLVSDYAHQRGVARLVLVTSIGIERLMLRAGVPAHRVAPPAMIDGKPHVALFIEVEPKAGEQPSAPVPSQRLEAGRIALWNPLNECLKNPVKRTAAARGRRLETAACRQDLTEAL